MSVTRPTAWKVPRSASFVTTPGLMSTQSVFTVAGSRFPTAIECNIVPIIIAIVTPPSFRPHRSLRLERVGDDVGQRAVVADRPARTKSTCFHTGIHDAALEQAALDRRAGSRRRREWR